MPLAHPLHSRTIPFSFNLAFILQSFFLRNPTCTKTFESNGALRSIDRGPTRELLQQGLQSRLCTLRTRHCAPRESPLANSADERQSVRNAREIGFYEDTDTCIGVPHFLATQYLRTKGFKPQFPKGIVSSVSFVSTTNTARSLAGFIWLALALTPWRSPGNSEKLCPAA